MNKGKGNGFLSSLAKKAKEEQDFRKNNSLKHFNQSKNFIEDSNSTKNSQKSFSIIENKIKKESIQENNNILKDEEINTEVNPQNQNYIENNSKNEEDMFNPWTPDELGSDWTIMTNFSAGGISLEEINLNTSKESNSWEKINTFSKKNFMYS